MYGETSAGIAAALATMRFHDAHQLAARAMDLGSEVKGQLGKQIRNMKYVRGVRGVGLELSISLDWQYCYEQTGSGPLDLFECLRYLGLFVAFSRHECELMFMPPLSTSTDLRTRNPYSARP